MRTILLALAFALAVVGCRDNTTCTTGTRLCTEDDGTDYTGDPFKGGGTQLRVCSTTGPGADEDGEFVVEQDCGKKNQICLEDVAFDTDDHTHDGCIDPKCGGVSGGPCVKEGDTACLQEALFACQKNADGCLAWTLQVNCADANGTTCAYQGDVASCQ